MNLTNFQLTENIWSGEISVQREMFMRTFGAKSGLDRFLTGFDRCDGMVAGNYGESLTQGAVLALSTPEE